MRQRELALSHKARTGHCSAYCGALSEHETGTCIVTMQYGDEERMRVAYQAEYPSQEKGTSVIVAFIMANNAYEAPQGLLWITEPYP